LLKLAGQRNDHATDTISRSRPKANSPELPAGWIHATLRQVANVKMGQSPPGDTYNKTGEGIPLINGPVEFTEGAYGLTVVNQFTTKPTKLCDKGDFLICVRGSTTGRTNIAAFNACIGRGVAAIRPHFGDAYLKLFICSSREVIIGMGRGIAFPSISRKQLEDFPVLLPPLAEQHRIVAKVNELNALCDELESSLTTTDTTRKQLLESLLSDSLSNNK
jgi:type I restriction enzyme S subunit